jgi:hypothetical protein
LRRNVAEHFLCNMHFKDKYLMEHGSDNKHWAPFLSWTVVAQSAHTVFLWSTFFSDGKWVDSFLLWLCQVIWYWVCKYFKHNKEHLFIMQPYVYLQPKTKHSGLCVWWQWYWSYPHYTHSPMFSPKRKENQS